MRGRGLMLTTHPHPVPSSTISRNFSSSPPKRPHGVWWYSFFLGINIAIFREDPVATGKQMQNVSQEPVKEQFRIAGIKKDADFSCISLN
jgi:hypothetical protein